MNEGLKNTSDAPNPDASKWESLYQNLEKNINDNFLDDKDFIDSKLKRPIEYSKEDAENDLKKAEEKRDHALKHIHEKIAEDIVKADSEAGKWLADELKNIEDMKFDEEKADEYRREVYERAVKKQLEADHAKDAPKDSEDTSKAPEDAPKSPEDKQARETELQMNQEIERQAAEVELTENIQEQMEIEQRKLEEELYQNIQAQMELEEKQPLTAVNIDYSHDEKEIARDLAEQALNAEISDAKGIKGAVKRIWKGTLFRKFFEKRYTNQFISGERTTENGETALNVLKKQMPDTMERFVLSAVEEEDGYVHGKSGERLEEVDKETNEKLKSAIAEYARKRPGLGENVADLNREFKNEIGRILAEKMDSDSGKDNYLQVAEEAAKRYQELAVAAKTKAEHEAALEQVMAGFQAYNAEARSNVRTEAHYDGIDKLIDKIESRGLDVVPAEYIAGALGVITSLTQTGARAALGAAGGIAASGIISGLKERNRITEDRVRMMRDIANGMDYDAGKYEKKIGGTLYDMQPASKLAASIQDAIDYKGEDRAERLMEAIAEARVRIDFSDSKQKDLISYSSSSSRGKERLELDKILIKAERALSEKGREKYELIQDEIRQEIIEGYEDEAGNYHAGVKQKDKDFKKFRALSAMKKAGKSLAIGGAMFFVSQEVMAAIDPAKIGVFEKAGILKGENNTDAKETILASGFGKMRGTYEVSGAPRSDIHENISDPEQVRMYEEAGYTKVETAPATHEATPPDVAEVDPSASTARVEVRYDGWANNGTKLSDGNELRAHIENGKFVSTMRGASTMNGQAIDYDPSSIKAYLTLGDSKFEIAGSLNEAGQMTWGENGVFTTTTGETIKAISDNGEKLYKYFEIAVDNGPDADGITHIVPLATDAGTNSFSDKIQQLVEGIPVERPATYTFIKDIAGPNETVIRDITTNGVGFAPDVMRRGLGRAYNAPETPAASEEAPEAPMAPEAESIPEAPSAPEVNPSNNPIEIPTAPENLNSPELTNETIEVTPLVAPNSPENVIDFVNNYQRAIDDSRGVIGDVLANALMTTEDYISNASDNSITWANAIRNLSPDGRAALKRILDMRDSLGDDTKYLKFGNGFAVFREFHDVDSL